jgi:hypothetical protein
MVQKRVQTGFWWEKVKESDQLKDLGIDGRILERILKRWDRRLCTGFIWQALVNFKLNKLHSVFRMFTIPVKVHIATTLVLFMVRN